MNKQTNLDNHNIEINENIHDLGGYVLNRVYVVMPFNEDMDAEYDAICEVCENLGLRSRKVEKDVDSENILKEITYHIERAEFIIFDLTHERANVYYTLGYAHGIGNEAFDFLLIAKEETKPHFDISPLKINYYKNTEDLRTIISSNLKHMIEMTR